MEDLARERGLVPVAAVTRSGCDVLGLAETGGRSTRSWSARRWGTPALSAAEFTAWARP